MSKLQVFDRPMCCSTGICGPAVDPGLVRFAADLDWLKSQGVQVERHNLAQQPGAFTVHDDVKEVLVRENVACLPLVRVDARIVSQGVYPSREELARWCGVRQAVSLPVAPRGCCGSTGCC